MTDPTKKSRAPKLTPFPKPPITRKRNVQHAAPTSTDVTVGDLMSRLWERAAAKKHSLPELAEQLDISYVYLMALARGERPTAKIDRNHLILAAKYLGLPVGQIYLMAGVLLPEDFIFNPTKDEKIQYTMAAMRNDPLWAAHAPTDDVWKHADPSLRLLVCFLYERAARTSFFDGTEVPVYSEKS